MLNECRYAPGQHHKQSDQRQISIAVGAALNADLDEADGRHEHADEPEPAKKQKRMFAGGEDYCGSDDEKKDCRSRDLRCRPGSGMRVKNGKMVRPKHIEDV